MNNKLFLTPEEVVQRYEGRVNVRTLANWRSAGVSPPFTKVGGRILYPLDDLIEWEKRRTWKTLAGQIGISKEDRDRLQNHAQGDVSSVHYDRYDYLKEKRAAMLQWGTWFEATIEKRNAT